MSKQYRRRPSEFFPELDEYTAYCLDEACAYIISQLEDGKELVFHTHYSSFSDLYANYK